MPRSAPAQMLGSSSAHRRVRAGGGWGVPQLRTLSIDNRNIPDASITAIAARCPLLEHLGLTFASVTDVGITARAARCPLLQHLKLYHTGSVTDTGISAIGQHCPRLTELTCTGLALHDSLFVIARGCPNLTRVTLAWNSLVDDAIVSALAAGCPHLCWLCVYASDSITSASTGPLRARGCRVTKHRR